MHDLGIWLFGAIVGGCVGFLWAALIRAAGKAIQKGTMGTHERKQEISHGITGSERRRDKDSPADDTLDETRTAMDEVAAPPASQANPERVCRP